MRDYLLWQHECRKRWITHSKEEIEVLNNAIQKKQKIAPLRKKKIVVDLEKMIQKNVSTLCEQRVRCLVSSSGFYVWLWKDDNDDWQSYKPNLAILLEVAHTNGDKEFKFYDDRDYEVNLHSFEQLNKETLQICPVKREHVKVSTTAEIKSVQDLKPAQIAKLQTNKPPSKKRKRPAAALDCEPAILNIDSSSSSLNPMDIDDSVSSGADVIVPVDIECPEEKNFHLYCKGKRVFSAILNQSDLENDSNIFYIIQLLEHNQEQQYAVWLRWGRVGCKSQCIFTKYGSSFPDALASFSRKFYKKTRNKWNNIDNFVHVPGKYDLLRLNPESGVKRVKQDIKSKLPARVKDLMEIICDPKRMEDMMKEMSYDSNKMPLGQLTLDHVKEGYIVLNRITEFLTSGVDGSELTNACNDFYRKIPHNFGMNTPLLINTREDVDDKLEMLDALSNISVAMGIFNANLNTIEHPLDKYYNSLNCSLEVLSSECPEYQEIKKCLQETHGPTHVEYLMEIIDAFRCCKQEEESLFIESDNKFLLWHGSRITNWIGILKEGLCVSPPEAPVTGYMFGKGIYFADASSKSANYCFATKTNNEGLLLLCEVSVGKQVSLYESDVHLPSSLPTGYDSVLGKGCITPQEFKTGILSSKAKAPFGPLRYHAFHNGSLMYNEYIVYDVRRVKMKYLIRTRFKFYS